MYIRNDDLNKLIIIENKLAKDKKYYNEFCSLCTIIENLLQQKNDQNAKSWQRIKIKRLVNKNYARGGIKHV